MKSLKFLQENTVLLICVGIFAMFSLSILFFTEAFYDLLTRCSLIIRSWFGRYYLYLGLACVVILLLIALLPYGRITLGKEGEKPEFSRLSWLAMLYSAGMGAGVLLRAVQEPVFMLVNPPLDTRASDNAMALAYTFYQWGFTAWAFYGLFALIIGFAVLKRDKKPLLSNILKKKTNSTRLLKGLDILVILTTVTGVTGAICLGTTQITGGVNYLAADTFYGLNLNMGALVLICLLAFISAWQGLNRGIKIVSNLNIALTTLLFIYVLLQGNIPSILLGFSESLYYYIIDFIPMSLAIGNYDPGEAFLKEWTYYYWAFWIAWAPFTGIFIARISRGRSIREFVLGVLIIPSLASFIWFSGFGDTAFNLIEDQGGYTGQFSDEFASLFEFFSYFPWSGTVNVLIIILLLGFLITSADSAIYVLSMFTDKGKLHPQKKHRLIWAVLLAVGGVALLVLSDIKAEVDIINILQLLLVVTSLPFALLIPVLILLFLKDIRTSKT